MLKGINEIIHVTCLMESLAHRKCSTNSSHPKYVASIKWAIHCCCYFVILLRAKVTVPKLLIICYCWAIMKTFCPAQDQQDSRKTNCSCGCSFFPTVRDLPFLPVLLIMNASFSSPEKNLKTLESSGSFYSK